LLDVRKKNESQFFGQEIKTFISRTQDEYVNQWAATFVHVAVSVLTVKLKDEL
jgi:hypothetical protein